MNKNIKRYNPKFLRQNAEDDIGNVFKQKKRTKNDYKSTLDFESPVQ